MDLRNNTAEDCRRGIRRGYLITDAPLPDLGKPIPADDKYRHFGGGRTRTTVELTPGVHTLQLLLGDHAHMPHAEPVYSDVVTIAVE